MYGSEQQSANISRRTWRYPLLLSGYSLVELLVAIVVGSIVIAAAYGSYQVVLGMFIHSDQQAELHLAGREAMYLLSRDIRMAGFENPENTTLGAITTPLNNVVSPLLPCGTRDDYTNHELTIQYDDMNSGPDIRHTVTYSIDCRVELDSENARLPERDRLRLLRAVDGGTAVTLMHDIGNLQFTFFFNNGGNGNMVLPNLGIQQVAIRLDAIALSVQRGTSAANRLSTTYQAMVKTPNLYLW